jgi:hypothetical protein
MFGLGTVGCEDIDPQNPPTPNNPTGTLPEDDEDDPESSNPCPEAEICRLEKTPDQASVQVPFSTNKDFVTVRSGSSYRPIFMKGVNLGVGVPGTRAGHLAATREQYAQWFEQMTDMGVNTLRIYTLHYPRFYEELAKHNQANPDRPLYILHGIWLHEEFAGLDLLTDGFRQNIREAVDCAHGNCHINPRFGKAFGTYDTDISQWIMAWIIGREVTPSEVELTNESMRGQTNFEGTHVRVTDAQPAEVWWGEQVDFLIGYEMNGTDEDTQNQMGGYGQTRPISVSSWPTLDPMEHPTEVDDFSSEDINTFDMLELEPANAPGGFFATFHAYPYYPDFIVDQSDYRGHSDAEGKNSYLGYLSDLKSHYADMPLYIGETGVSSSWGNAHYGFENMNHGGHTEVEQGEIGARLFRTAHDTNCAGAALFAWIDEWWKPTWITDPRGSDGEHKPFWHNVTAPEQNFGLIAFDLGPPNWDEESVSTAGSGLVERVTLIHDTAYFHVRLDTTGQLAAGGQLVVAFDTYGSAESGQFNEELGESMLPNGVTTTNRNEFALEISGTDTALLKVTQSYDSKRIWYGARFADGQFFESQQTDGADWNLVSWLNSQEHGIEEERDEPEPNRWFEETFHEIGDLTIRAESEDASSHDAVVVGDSRIDIRIPWTLLNVTDPARRKVLHASPNAIRKGSPQHAVTRGIAVGVTHGGELLVETDRYGWETWGEEGILDVPGYDPGDSPIPSWGQYERVKAALPIFGEALQDLPYWMD